MAFLIKKNKILSISLVVILVASAIVPAKLANAYEEDIHYWLTFKLALFCGFTPNQSRLIATGDQGIDANFATEPTKLSILQYGANPFSSNTWDNLNIKIKWHALPPDNPVSNPQLGITEIQQEQQVLYDRVTSETNPSVKLIKFGQYLHYIEDKWSHWGYTFEVGHGLVNVFGQSPDNPSVTSLALKDMIYDVLTQLGGLAGKDSKYYNAALGGDNPFISPANFPGDFKVQYPNGSPTSSNGTPYQDMSGQRDSYFNNLNSSNSKDTISDLYNDLVNTAQTATAQGKSLEQVVEEDIPAIQNHIAKEMGVDVNTVRQSYDFITPWKLVGPFGFALWLFSDRLDQGIHWNEDGNPIEPIDPNPNNVFIDPKINPNPQSPGVPPLPPPTPTPAPPPGQNAGNIPNAKTATLVVLKHVINDGGGTAKASDFQITVNPGPYLNVNPYTFAGSENGVTVTLSGKFDQMLHYTVSENSPYGDSYQVTKTDNCSTYINAGENLTCIIYNVYKPSQTAMNSPTQTLQPTKTPTQNQPATQNAMLIPSWIKNNAKWWSEGQTSDKEFAMALGYLTANGILSVQSRAAAHSIVNVSDQIQIPSWIKNDASWWSKGFISDSEFLKGTQYMLDNNIITFSKQSTIQGQSSKNDITLKILDSQKGEPLDAVVTISGGSHYLTQDTDRDGTVHFLLSDGDYVVTVDSQNCQRLMDNLPVIADITKTYDLQCSQSGQIKPQPSTGTTTTPPPSTGTTTPSSSTPPLQVSASPTTISFTHNIGMTACPEPIGQASLQSNQQGTWSVSSSPSWTMVSIQGSTVSINFNCQLSQYVTQTLSGNVVFQFTASDGATATSSISIFGQINQG